MPQILLSSDSKEKLNDASNKHGNLKPVKEATGLPYSTLNTLNERGWAGEIVVSKVEAYFQSLEAHTKDTVDNAIVKIKEAIDKDKLLAPTPRSIIAYVIKSVFKLTDGEIAKKLDCHRTNIVKGVKTVGGRMDVDGSFRTRVWRIQNLIKN